MDGEHRAITVTNGRTVEVLTTGPAEGLPLVVHDGTPGGLVAFPPLIDAASVRGLRIVMYARPGYGRSTPRPGRRVADAADDVAAILDALGAETFLTVGWSGGGPHALACAARLPDRCLAASSVAGVAPRRAAGLDWMAGMAEENVVEFGAAEQGPDVLTRHLEQEAAAFAGVTGARLADALGGLLSSADRAVLAGEVADHVAASLRAALSGGIAGWRDDDLAFVGDWGFAPDAGDASAPTTRPGDALLDTRTHTVPVAIWHGDQDRMVPFEHGRWLARHIPAARPHLLRGEGHLTLVATAIDRILDDLLELAGFTG